MHRPRPRRLAPGVISAILTAGFVAMLGGFPPAPARATDGMPDTHAVGDGTLRASQSQSHTFPLDTPAPCAFMIMYADGELDLEAVSPSGRVWSTRGQGPGGGSQRSKGVLFTEDGWTDGVSIESPEIGTWTLKVTARSVPDSVAEVSYVVLLMRQENEQGPVLRFLMSDIAYPIGKPVDVRASLLEAGAPVTGAEIRAGVVLPMNEPLQLTLLDDGNPPDSSAGDGIYSGRTPPLREPGNYFVSVSASRSGVAGKPDFRRTEMEMIGVSRSRSRLNGRFRDSGRDTNGDGLADEFVIQVGVTVTDRAHLALRAMLLDEQGRVHDGHCEPVVLEPGERVLELKFPTEFLYEAGATGPFVLDTLRLYESEEGWIAPLDERTGAYRTKEYGRAAFRHEKILLNGEVEARGVDADGNGAFESLIVEVGVDIDFPGLYGWHAVLASGKAQFAWEGASVQGGERAQLQKGSNRLRFQFPGACIHRLRDGGGYYLAAFGVGLLHRGEPPKGAPRYSFSAPAIQIPSAPPPGEFEKTGPEPYRSSLGGTYSCSDGR